jgi:hypothetical protein
MAVGGYQAAALGGNVGQMAASVLQGFWRSLTRRAGGAPLAGASGVSCLCTTEVDLGPLAVDFCREAKKKMGVYKGSVKLSLRLTLEPRCAKSLTHVGAGLACWANAIAARLAVATGEACKRDAWTLDRRAGCNRLEFGWVAHVG